VKIIGMSPPTRKFRGLLRKVTAGPSTASSADFAQDDSIIRLDTPVCQQREQAGFIEDGNLQLLRFVQL
jgi:hypothetical protein